MSDSLPTIYLARHGETAWTVTGQHTGRTDIPLTAQGEENARRLGTRFKEIAFDRVITSPRQRARRTCELAGFGVAAEIEPLLAEWDYGEYEGKRTQEIRAQRPGWDLFADGCPSGESPVEIAGRADKLIGNLRALTGTVLLFGHAHMFRVLAVRWIALPITEARHFVLGTATLSIMGFDHGSIDEPVIRLWNDSNHLR